MAKIKIGYAPTRRSIFSAPDAVKYCGLTADRLKELGIDFDLCHSGIPPCLYLLFSFGFS